MKNLASLTNFFITFLFVVYSGVFVGLKINGFISDKKLVSTTAVPLASALVSPTPQSSVTLAEAPQTKAPTQISTQTAPTSNPAEVSAPATSIPSATQAPPPAVDTSAPPPPVDTPPPPAPPPPSEPPPSSRCIITISGGQYDVTEFRNIHSGGDVFQCGTDMTAAFLSRHPASFLSKMSQYKV